MAGSNRATREHPPYQCCFCAEMIESIWPDVASLLFTTCVDLDEGNQKSHELFCHIACLQVRLHPSAKLYALDLARLSVDEDSDPHPPNY